MKQMFQFDSIESVAADLRKGKLVIVVDDAERHLFVLCELAKGFGDGGMALGFFYRFGGFAEADGVGGS